MKPISMSRVVLWLLAVVAFSSCLQAQPAGPGISAAPAQPVSPNVISFSDTIAGQPDGAITVAFALYPDQQSLNATWTETQVVQVIQNKYTVLLGSTTPDGIPPSVFAADQARWLGVQVNGTEKRYLLVSVPYAMKAMEAERLGGLLPSDFVTTQQLQTILLNSATPGAVVGKTGTPQTVAAPTQAASTSPPQPATDFTDNNASEVLLVTQQGTGFAIHAVSAGDAALFAENSKATGTALKAVATGTSGANIGVLGQSASSTGIAGVFDNTGNGQILSLRANGNEVASVDNLGNFKATQIQALNFVGPGLGLTNIPNSATTATPSNTNNTIVARDQFGNFSATQIQALNFVGPAFGLTNIPNSATTATPANVSGTIVARDQSGNFSAAQIQALNFVGPGFGLTNIPNSATTATPSNTNNTIVARDQSGNFSAAQIQALNFVGSGFGLTNISSAAVGATPNNVNGAIVARDSNGNFSAGNIQALSFAGNGFGLTNVPASAINATPDNVPNSVVQRDVNGRIAVGAIFATSGFFGDGSGLNNIQNAATTATSSNTANAIVARDAGGNFSAGNIVAGSLSTTTGGFISSSGVVDFSAATSTAPVRAVLSANTPTTCNASRELLLKTDAVPGQQLFICNANGDGYVLVGDGTAAGVVSLGAGDSSVTVGGTAAAPTIAVANGGITGAKLAPNSVSGANLANGSVTSVQLAANAVTSANVADGALSPTKIAGTAATLGTNTFTGTQTMFGGLVVDGNLNIQAPGSALVAAATDPSGAGTAGVFTNAGPGIILSGLAGLSEVFNVDTNGNLLSSGALSTKYPSSGTFANGPVKLMPNGAVRFTIPADSFGNNTIGIAISNPDFNGNVQIAYAGRAVCQFDTFASPFPGDYVGVSRRQAGACTDLGQSPPSGVQIIGRILLAPQGTVLQPGTAPVLLFATADLGGSLSLIDTGAGLTGGPITSSGTISIANAGVTNAMLQNSSVTVNPGAGLSGGGIVPLGGSLTVNNAGALSFNGRTGNVIATPGDYSFNQLSGAAAPSQLPAATVFNNQSNTFSADQTISGALNATTANLQNVAVNTTSSQFLLAPLQISDNGQAPSALYAFSVNHKAAAFQATGPVILTANNFIEDVFTVFRTGEVSVLGGVTARAFTGDGSALFNVNASSVGGVPGANLATTTALNSETSARQSADAALQTSINAETVGRQSDVSNLQASINTVSAADAKLATANTFTASNTFTSGTQDFSAAGATLPVRTLPTAQTPGSCVASKELLIKTDAPAGQQLFICDASGATWNLVGDGASGGVTSFNGRNGSVSPSSNDYSFAQISGSVAPGQMPALTGELTSAAGSVTTILAPSGVTAGTYTKLTVDAKGRATSGGPAGFSDLTGAATAAQLPGSVVYNNQANTFGANQAVNGTLTATLFSGNGGGLSNVNAATLGGIASSNFALLSTDNSFSGTITAAGFSGNGSGLTNVNAATVNNFQMLKLTASLTPSNVNAQTCNEQTFTVSGVNSGDVLLGVQLATHSPGTNIAIGGWRVSAASTVAIQFCNVSRSSSTPAAGAYTLALMR